MTDRTAFIFAVVLAAVLAFAAGLVLGAATSDGATQPAAASADCTHTRRVIIVNLDNQRHRVILRHAWHAIHNGEPEILHLARDEADANRDASLSGRYRRSWGQLTYAERKEIDPDHPARTDPHDRDEYPPAFSDEGGNDGPANSPRGRLADVEYVDASANRSAGAVMGAKLAPYCDGQRFRFERKPGPK